MVNTSSEHIGEFLISTTTDIDCIRIQHNYSAMFGDFKFGNFLETRQFAKLRSSPNFFVIRTVSATFVACWAVLASAKSGLLAHNVYGLPQRGIN